MNLASTSALIIAIASSALAAFTVSAQTQGLDPVKARHEKERRSADPDLVLGQEAPTFVLPAAKGEEHFDLREFRGQKPVILFLGSYT